MQMVLIYPPSEGSTIPTLIIFSYNQFELTPTEDVYNQGYSSGDYYAVYNFIDYELGSESFEYRRRWKL